MLFCERKHVDTAECLEWWRKALEERNEDESTETQIRRLWFEMKQYGDRSKVKILVVELENVTHFKFLESIMEDKGGMETERKRFLMVVRRKCSGVSPDYAKMHVGGGGEKLSAIICT